MDYLLKSSAIIAIFYICYSLFLQKETFFVGNRWFLFSGLLVSLIVPFLVIPIYVETPTIAFDITTTSSEVSTIQSQENPFDIKQLLLVLYYIGFLFFLGKLALEFGSLYILIKKNFSKKEGVFTYVETTSELAPFSFFKWIVFNPNQFNVKELNLIINHEKVHARQFHSIDVIGIQLLCILFWFNPFIWLYKKALQQNLEFIADQEAQAISSCEKSYQNLLLRTSLPSHQLILANNFYNSLIKKRIVMLHKSKSNRINAWKYSLVLPLIIAFVFNFNTEIIAQTKKTESEKVTIGQNVIRFVISKDTKDLQLESIKKKLADVMATINFSDVTRNDRKEITGIKIDYEHAGKTGNFFLNSDNPIKDIAVSLNVNENELSVGQSTKSMSQSFEIIKEDGKTQLKKEATESNVVVYSTDNDDEKETEKVVVLGKDGEEHEVKKEKKVYVIKSGSTKNSDETVDGFFIKKNKKDTVWIKQDVKNIIWTDDDGTDVEIMTVERGNHFQIIGNAGEQPLIILDGKEITNKDMDKVNPETIENVNVLKGEKAKEKYGKKGEHGAIEITTKKN